MHKYKPALRFTLSLLPITAAAGYFTVKYQLPMLDPRMIETAVQQVGSLRALIGITVLQTVLYAAVCGFFGYILSAKIGLMRPFGFRKANVLRTLAASVIFGILFSLDPWIFGKALPEIRTADAAGLTSEGWLAGILYGGIVEELMLRLFFMSLIVLLLWKIFLRKQQNAPAGSIIAGNVIAALLFAAGHLPATAGFFGTLTPILLLRCFLLNGSAGMLFGRLYRKYGIQYAMLSHALFHIVTKTVWTLFL